MAGSCLAIASCMEADHLLLPVYISSRALEKSQGGLSASPNCVYGDAFVVEKQRPKQMQVKSSFHVYVPPFGGKIYYTPSF